MTFQVQDTVYKRRIFLFVGSRLAFEKHLTETWGQKYAKGICKDACGQMWNFYVPSTEYEGVKTQIYYLWAVRFNGTSADIGTLSHESFHIATTILEDLGVDTIDKEGSESIAYYAESIFVQCLTHLRGE